MLAELTELAIGNLARARARLLMTSGGVLVGTTAVILLIALTIGLQNAAERGIGSSASLTELYVYPNSGQQAQNKTIPTLNNDALLQFWRIKGVSAVMPIINLQNPQIMAGKYMTYPQVIALDPRLLPYLGFTAERGTLSLNPGEILVGSRAGDNFFDPKARDYEPIKVDLLAQAFKLRIAKNTSTGVALRSVPVKASAVLAPSGGYDYAFFMNMSDVLNLNEWISGQKFDPKKARYDQVLIRTINRDVTTNVADEIRELGFQAGGAVDFLNQLNGFFGTMRLMLGGIGGVALLVAAFGVANTMTMAILERTKEIGLMKAIGATDRDILTVFLIEAALVGLIGGVAGILLSVVLQNVINEAVRNAPTGGATFLPVDPSQIGGNLMVIPPELFVFALVLSTGVGLLAGLYPALRAAQLAPVIALKTE